MRPASRNSGALSSDHALGEGPGRAEAVLVFQVFPRFTATDEARGGSGDHTLAALGRSIERARFPLCQFISHLISQSALRFAAVRCMLRLVTAGQSRGFSFSGDLEGA